MSVICSATYWTWPACGPSSSSKYTSGWPAYQSGSTARILTRHGARIGAPTGMLASTPWSVRSQTVTYCSGSM